MQTDRMPPGYGSSFAYALPLLCLCYVCVPCDVAAYSTGRYQHATSRYATFSPTQKSTPRPPGSKSSLRLPTPAYLSSLLFISHANFVFSPASSPPSPHPFLPFYFLSFPIYSSLHLHSSPPLLLPPPPPSSFPPPLPSFPSLFTLRKPSLIDNLVKYATLEP